MKKLIGDKEFLKRVATVAIPIIIQNGITNFVSLLDNIMVGKIGTEQMSGVAIVNQLLFILSLALFGAVSGPGIFTAQYVGQKNNEGVRHTVRIKLIYCVAIALIGIFIFTAFQNDLIMLFLHKTSDNINLEDTLAYAKSYMMVMLLGMPIFAITQAYAGTLREAGETKVPMIAGIVATFINLAFNYILIFGHFGAPTLGVVGAAIATDISRVIEFLIIVIWTHANKERCPYAVGLYKGFKIPGNLLTKVTVKGFPLFLNELMWSMGMSALTQCYSMR
ncbi:MAG: polysaccharide biosynthesis C-terminal domain-containing protein, partial [Lachnospiraceae bacterium]|nr:polysaccharide biosynthesis C-terminal domain-containing protein [Lachnospiraceae bacterium]